MSITAAEFDDIHSCFGDDISVNDADGRIYDQPTCRCGMPLGMHLSLETHRAAELEEYIQGRIDEALSARRTAWANAQYQVADLFLAMQDRDAPLYVQAALEQIITDAEIRMHNTFPGVILSRAVEAGPPLVMILTP